MTDSAAPCATGARQIKLGKDAGRSPSWSGWGSPRTKIQRRYDASSARAWVVKSVISDAVAARLVPDVEDRAAGCRQQQDPRQGAAAGRHQAWSRHQGREGEREPSV